MASLARPDSF
jgi:hypothetical protein